MNVVKGFTGEGCDSVEPADPLPAQPAAYWYPRDTCFTDGSCHQGRFGTGDWQATTFDHDFNPDTDAETYYHPDPDGNPDFDLGPVEPYWAINHSADDGTGTYEEQPTNVNVTTGLTPAQGIDYADMTRYQLYRYEIETDPAYAAWSTNVEAGEGPGIPDQHEDPDTMFDEQGNPSCYSNNPQGVPAGMENLSDPIFDDPTTGDDDGGLHTIDRRVFRLVVINCLEQGPLNGNEDDVPTIGTTEVFLTEPAQGSGNDQADIYGEFIRATPPGTDEGLKDIVQLYR
jgi:hypothetical protein